MIYSKFLVLYWVPALITFIYLKYMLYKEETLFLQKISLGELSNFDLLKHTFLSFLIAIIPILNDLITVVIVSIFAQHCFGLLMSFSVRLFSKFKVWLSIKPYSPEEQERQNRLRGILP